MASTPSLPRTAPPRVLVSRPAPAVDAGRRAAKATVGALLREMGWQDGEILDLGDITTARGTEQYLALWVRLMKPMGGANFNIKLVK